MPPVLVVHIVTFNSEKYIQRCLESLLNQEKLTLKKNYQIIVSDNTSSDSTLSLINKHFPEKVSVTRYARNIGFSKAHNLGIKQALALGARYVFVCNPDVTLEPTALDKLLSALELDTAAGMACPKLYRADEDGNAVSPAQFDTTGMFIRPDLRHFDRGSNELDTEQFAKDEYVFGASGAAVMLTKEFIADLNLQDNNEIELFDNNFFAYREDADLSWRAQWLGWKTRYVSDAVGYHVRKVLPENRALLPQKLNRLGVQNRFLLQINNFSLAANLNCFLPALWRNILVIGAALSVEITSAPAFWGVAKHAKSAFRNRALIAAKRAVSPSSIGKWFSYKPVAKPALSLKVSAAPIKTLQVVIVNYNSDERLKHCLTALIPSLNELEEITKIQVVVADNCSSDESISKAYGQILNDKRIVVKQMGQNAGFAGAINRSTLDSDYDAILILNPDIELRESTLSKLLDAINRHDNLGAVAPILYDRDESAQHGFVARSFPTLSSTLAELFFLHRLWPSNPATSHYKMLNEKLFSELLTAKSNDARLKIPYIVEQPAGACLLARGTAFKELAGLDQNFWPAWFEDVDFCKRLADKHWLSAIIPETKAIHEGGYSYKQLSNIAFAKIWYANQLRYWLKHGTRKQYLATRTALCFAMPLRAAAALVQAMPLAFKDRSQAVSLVNYARGLVSIAIRPFAAKQKFERGLAAEIKTRLASFAERIKMASNTLRDKSVDLNDEDTEISYSRTALPIQATNYNFANIKEEDKDWRAELVAQCRGRGKQIAHANFPVVEAVAGPWALGEQFISVEVLKGLTNDGSVEVLNQKQTQSVPLNVSSDENDERTHYDFLVISHALEYVSDPLGTLQHYLSHVRRNGIVYLIVSDKRFSDDRSRVRTSLEHILLDYCEPSVERDLEHYIDYAVHCSELDAEAAIDEANKLLRNQTPIRFHTFTPDDVLSLLKWFSKNIAPLSFVTRPGKVPGSNECHYLLRLKAECRALHQSEPPTQQQIIG